MHLPERVKIPEKAEDWLLWAVPEDLTEMAKKHEDRTMIAKWAFQKPELTYFHIKNIIETLQDHFLVIQMMPLLKFSELYADVVLENTDVKKLSQLKTGRILMNLNFKEEGLQLKELVGDLELSEEQKKVY